MKIVKNKNKLRIPTKPCESVEEGIEIANTLIWALENRTGGIGLSANQVGISKSVSIVNARKNKMPMILINPVCTGVSEEKVAYIEGCISLPGKPVKTIRHKPVTVKCDNWENEITFGPDSTELNNENYWKDEGLMEAVCVQHEMDHLEGKLITDEDIRFPVKTTQSNKIGRNQKVMVKKDDETKFLKFKKAKDLLQEGWEII